MSRSKEVCRDHVCCIVSFKLQNYVKVAPQCVSKRLNSET